jgi:hypothetical protein
MGENVDMKVNDDENVDMKVNEVDVPIIHLPPFNETKNLVTLTEKQREQEYKISKESIQFIKIILEIISQRNTFKIDEFKIVGSFYEMLREIKDETISGDSIQRLLNILHTCSKRGTFRLNEFEIISKLYSSICKVIQ